MRTEDWSAPWAGIYNFHFPWSSHMVFFIYIICRRTYFWTIPIVTRFQWQIPKGMFDIVDERSCHASWGLWGDLLKGWTQRKVVTELFRVLNNFWCRKFRCKCLFQSNRTRCERNPVCSPLFYLALFYSWDPVCNALFSLALFQCREPVGNALFSLALFQCREPACNALFSLALFQSREPVGNV